MHRHEAEHAETAWAGKFVSLAEDSNIFGDPSCQANKAKGHKMASRGRVKGVVMPGGDGSECDDCSDDECSNGEGDEWSESECSDGEGDTCSEGEGKEIGEFEDFSSMTRS